MITPHFAHVPLGKVADTTLRQVVELPAKGIPDA